jgi:hypothetical protein
VLDHVFSVLISMCDSASSSTQDNAEQGDSEMNNTKQSGERAERENGLSTRVAARSLLAHLLNNLLHFPAGADVANISSDVSECDDLPGLEDMSVDILQQPNIQFFIRSDATLISFVELPEQNFGKKHVRLILRDVSGKFAWDLSSMHLEQASTAPQPCRRSLESSILTPTNGKGEIKSHLIPDLQPAHMKQWLTHSPPPEPAQFRRQEDVLPVEANTAEDMDNLDDLLRYIGHTSPECLEALDAPLNSASASSSVSEIEQDVMKVIIEQSRCEKEAAAANASSNESRGRLQSPDRNGIKSPLEEQAFLQCRRLFSQLGLADWQSRKSLHLVQKNEKFLRQLKHLDSKRCRETHKIAVVYVGEGQEDRQSILSNARGSPAFEQFVSGLGWEVELASHAGFRGGLMPQSQATGETAPYFATSFVEVMFHVSTRMPSNSEESLLHKTRHIGNDEVHIVWSEHWRDYRTGILPTEFCDVLIVIYPLRNRLFRIQISRKPEVPFFGPLFNETIVNGHVLAGLVRATAINASRAKRSVLTYYQTHEEERFRVLESIVNEYKERSTFEEFITRVLSPVELKDQIQCSESTSSRPASFQDKSIVISESLETDGIAPLGSESRSSVRSEDQHLTSEPAADESAATKRKKLSFKAAASIMSSIKRSSSNREEPDSTN